MASFEKTCIHLNASCCIVIEIGLSLVRFIEIDRHVFFQVVLLLLCHLLSCCPAERIKDIYTNSLVYSACC